MSEQKLLQAYVAQRILQFNSQPQLQQYLGPQSTAALQAATQHLLGAAAAAGDGPATAAPPDLALVFRHDCQ